MGRLDAVLGAFQFALVHAVIADVGDLARYLALQVFKRMFRIGGRLYHELAGYFLRVVVHANLARRTRVIDHRAVQPRASPVAENGRQHIRRAVSLGERGRRGPSEIEARKLHAVAGSDVHRARQRRIHAGGAVDVRPGGDVAEVALGERQRLIRVEVADYGEAGVVGRIEALEERLDVFQRGVVQVFRRSDGRPVVRVRRREHGGLHQHRRHAVGTVLVVLAALVLHNVALDVQLALRQHFQQMPHAVGFQPEREFEVVGRDVLPVVGAVRRGGSVEVRADLLEGIEVAGVVVLGTFEHDVLEEVSEAGLARFFVLGADMIPDVDRRYGQAPIRR